MALKRRKNMEASGNYSDRTFNEPRLQQCVGIEMLLHRCSLDVAALREQLRAQGRGFKQVVYKMADVAAGCGEFL